MAFFRSVPIKHKLTIISMLASGAALLLACVAFLSFEYRIFRQALVADLQATAQVLGDNSAVALAFNYPDSAEVTLQSLAAKPHVLGAAVYDSGGRVFADYVARAAADGLAFAPPPARPDSWEFGADTLDVFRTISRNGEVLGVVTVRSSLGEMRERMWQYAYITLGVMLAASLAAFLLATRLQRVIVAPISQLAAITAAVANERNYSVRAVKLGDDELGQLMDGFNEMLNQIQARDGALQEARDHLEQRVDQRTAELQLEVAERKRAEAAVLEAKQGLERKVAERTTELTRKNIELERAIQAKDMFLANMSHELRTPLNAIIGFTGTLLMKLPGALNDKQEEQLTIVQTSARHLLSLINDLLDLTKIESGKVTLTTETLSCREILEDVVTALRPMAEQKALALALELPQTEWYVTTDRRALRQILLNLGSNAIKFTTTGSVTVAARACRRSDGMDAVEFSVTDTGVGIRPEFRGKLFQAFSQMDSTHREGSGLGLHLCRKLAHLIGGRIEFTSEPGKGSRFWLTLPLE